VVADDFVVMVSVTEQREAAVSYDKNLGDVSNTMSDDKVQFGSCGF